MKPHAGKRVASNCEPGGFSWLGCYLTRIRFSGSLSFCESGVRYEVCVCVYG